MLLIGQVLAILFGGFVLLFLIAVVMSPDMVPDDRATYLGWAVIAVSLGSILLLVTRSVRRRD